MNISLRAAMTSHPHSIRMDDTVQMARSKMASLDVHHLPVVEGGALRGVVSLHDLQLVCGNGADTAVRDVCTGDVISVDVEVNLFVVASLLADTPFGSVLVTEDDRLCGIFTATDARRVLLRWSHAHDR